MTHAESLTASWAVTEPELDLLHTDGVREWARSIRNAGSEAATLRDHDFAVLQLPATFTRLHYETSGWGQECMGRDLNLTAPFAFQNTRGRCSGEVIPFFTLTNGSISVDFSVCTSANYRVEVTPGTEGVEVRVCEPDPNFCVTLAPGEVFTYPSLLIHSYTSRKQSYREKHRYQQEHLLPSKFFDELPIVYNHWWAYLDKYLTEDVILENASAAKKIGVEMLVLDSGWFGKVHAKDDSFGSRGDWDIENLERFPHGIVWLRDQLEQMGLKFGIWNEIEGIGETSEPAAAHPEYIARRDGKSLGYLCFGDPEVQEWAYHALKNMIEKYNTRYWKLDFNLDPGFGCTCTEHGHGTGDGLYRHYEGLYKVMDRLIADYPDLVIENCSSGGQRLNLEIGKHSHVHFLSDPDYSTHQMRIFKTISRWLMPKQIIHFMWSNTTFDNGGRAFDDLNLDAASPLELRYHMRLAMMHAFGICHRLRDYSEETLNRMKAQIDLYKAVIRPFVCHGDFLPVYLSDHTNFFTYTKDNQTLILGFAEEPDEVVIDLSDLTGGQGDWVLTSVDTGEKQRFTAAQLSAYPFTAAAKWDNCLLLLEKA